MCVTNATMWFALLGSVAAPTSVDEVVGDVAGWVTRVSHDDKGVPFAGDRPLIQATLVNGEWVSSSRPSAGTDQTHFVRALEQRILADDDIGGSIIDGEFWPFPPGGGGGGGGTRCNERRCRCLIGIVCQHKCSLPMCQGCNGPAPIAVCSAARPPPPSPSPPPPLPSPPPLEWSSGDPYPPPSAPPAPPRCKDVEEREECKEIAYCKWSKKKCRKKKSLPPKPEPRCKDVEDKAECKDITYCKWSKQRCRKKDLEEPPLWLCEEFNTKKQCNDAGFCKWKKKKCKADSEDDDEDDDEDDEDEGEEGEGEEGEEGEGEGEGEEDEPECCTLEDEEECKDAGHCKWKENKQECKDK